MTTKRGPRRRAGGNCYPVEMPSPPQMPLFRGVVEAVEDGRPPVADERPHRLPSVTRRLELPYGTSDLVIDVTISYRDERPFEVFFNCAHLEMYEYLAAVSLLASRMLRNGFPVQDVARDLMDIASPHTGHMRRDGWCPSVAALIGNMLLEHAGPPAP